MTADGRPATPAPYAGRALILRRRAEHRLRNGHPWVFSNEVDVERSPLTGFEPGEQVGVVSAGGRFLATAYVNPRSLICARVVSREPGRRLDGALLLKRLRRALDLRERLYDTACYRLVHGESDALPGLVVDRYADVLVVQITTTGMQCLREPLLEALDQLLAPRALVLRNDAGGRALEGLETGPAEVRGELPEAVRVHEHGAQFRIDPLAGQKTGWYFDQYDNRARLARYLVSGARVLDLFCYVGAWSVRALLAGAGEVLGIDSSADALALAAGNAADNGVGERLHTRRGDVLDVLKLLRDEGRRFDVVIADPPAFVRRRKDLAAGVEAYRRLARRAMHLLAPDGTLVFCSCSSHLARDAMREVLRGSAARTGRDALLLEEGGQAPDHPMLPGMPESEYLKAAFVRVG